MRCRAAGVVLGSLLALRCGRHERPPLNVILITLDTTRADHLGCYGSRAGASPAIDRLASGGVRFEQADSVVPLTLPSHATLLTGLQPRRHGLHLNGVGTLRGSVDTLATVFSRRGFRTGAFVGSFLLDHRFGLGRGFGMYDDAVAVDPSGAPASAEAERPAAAVADAALAWLRETGARPFFAWIHFHDAHAPYAPPQPYRLRFAASPYDGEIAYVDSQVARIVDYLDAANLRDRTVVAIVGDHGEGLGEHDEAMHGLLLYESTLRVPLIIAAPSLHAQVVREAVSTTDVAPTLAALAGAPMNVMRLDGRDLSADMVSGREPAPRDLYAETQYPLAFGWSDLAALRRDGKKLISGRQVELFDLDRDPHETRNRSDRDRPTARELTAALRPVRASTSTADPRTRMTQLHEFERAAALLRSGDARAAIEIVAPLVRDDTQNPAFRSLLARAHDAAGEHDAALALYRQNVALPAANADTWYELASALQAWGDAGEAGKAIDEALRRDPNRAAGHVMSGISLAGSGDLAGAAAEFRKAIAIDPRNAQAYNHLGDTLRDMGENDDALTAYRRAAALAPQFAAPRESARALLARLDR